MSVQATTWVWENSLSEGSERLVLLAIADAANREGEASCQSLNSLAEMCRVSKSTVQRAIKKLLERGEVVATGTSAKYNTVIYKLGQMGVVNMTPPQKEGWSNETPRVVMGDHQPQVTPITSSDSLRSSSSVGPHSLPRGWRPDSSTLAYLDGAFGNVVDLEAERVGFVAYYLEHPERKFIDWNTRFGSWVAKDYKKTMEEREQRKDHDDEMGTPIRQRKTSRVDEMTEADREKELAAVRRRYENGATK